MIHHSVQKVSKVTQSGTGVRATRRVVRIHGVAVGVGDKGQHLSDVTVRFRHVLDDVQTGGARLGCCVQWDGGRVGSRVC